VTEIYGHKASGKTAILLEMIHLFYTLRPNKDVMFLNCASGVTIGRYNRIKKGLIYRDIYSLADILTVIDSLQVNVGSVGMIVIDESIKFVKVKEKPEV
jgi:RecA/RadA recombinase